MKPIVLRPGEGETILLGNAGSTSFKAEGKDTGSRISITESTLAAGFPGPKPHHHHETFDIFYVLEGTVVFRVGDDRLNAPAGSFVLVPPGVVHTFANPGDTSARVLNIQAPAGLEQYLREVAAESHGRPLDPVRMAEIASKYDFIAAG